MTGKGLGMTVHRNETGDRDMPRRLQLISIRQHTSAYVTCSRDAHARQSANAATVTTLLSTPGTNAAFLFQFTKLSKTANSVYETVSKISKDHTLKFKVTQIEVTSDYI